jgi:hypothetical protein
MIPERRKNVQLDVTVPELVKRGKMNKVDGLVEND